MFRGEGPAAQVSDLRRRCLVALILALAAFSLSEVQSHLAHPSWSDFGEVWSAIQALRQGDDPYVTVRALHPEFGFYYPYPALLVVWPLGYLSRVHAEAMFVGLGMGLFAYAAYGRPLLIGALSAGALSSVVVGQCALPLTASALLPALSVFWAYKPSIGLAVVAGYASRLGVVVGLIIVAVATMLWPGWIAAWLASIRQGSQEHIYTAPALRPWGWLLLLAGLRVRRPEGRMLLVLSLVPQVGALYDTVPLFLIPRTRWEAYGLAALTMVAAVAYARAPSLVETAARGWPALLGLVYLPALAMLLRPESESPTV